MIWQGMPTATTKIPLTLVVARSVLSAAPSPMRSFRLFFFAGALLAAGLAIAADIEPKAGPIPPGPTPTERARSALPAERDRDEAIRLNAFEVLATADTSYGALNSNSITRFNTELATMPVSADIFTKTFMDDVAASSV